MVILESGLVGCWLCPISLLHRIQSLKSQFCLAERASLPQIMF